MLQCSRRGLLRMPSQRFRGISLLEVLISMFILLFGLVGVASLFPIGKYHAQQALQYDKAAAIGQRAFEEIRVRGLLRPTRWNLQNGNRFTDQSNWRTTAVFFDPLAVAPPVNSTTTLVALSSSTLPRVTWRMSDVAGGNMSLPSAEAIFKVHDDLKYELPSNRNTPAIQRINATEREHDAAYSWAFTAIPARNMGEGYYLVSVVVFRNRLPGQEWRSANALTSTFAMGEQRVRLVGTPKQQDDIKMGEWVLVSARNQVGANFFRWYKIVSLSINSKSGIIATALQIQGPMRPGSYNDFINVTVFNTAVAVYTQIMKADSDVDWSID